jgi:signal transduction histidine kinase
MKYQLAGRRVLIVEDERAIAENLSFEIAAEGGKVVGPLATVNAALDVIANTVLDGAVLDLNLTGEMAFPVADALAARHIPFVIMTGFNARAVVPARHAGVSCLQKPVTPYIICRELEAIFDLSNADGVNLDIDYEGDAVRLSNDAAMPLALIANELLTNAVKYGLNGQAVRTIRVRLRREDDSFLFYVEDDGPGFDLQLVQQRSSGLKLVQGLARQLGGKFEVIRTPATRCGLRFQ